MTRVQDWVPPGWGARHSITLCAALMVAAATGLRGWAVAGGWFHGDDLEFLARAQDRPLTWSYVAEPHDDKLMPAAHVVSWLVARNGAYSWATAAAITIGGILLAGIACWWMLHVLFGDRWAILVPLGVYVWSPLTLPATMWWAASLNQLPLQIVMCTSVAAFVAHQRTRRLRHLAVLCLSLAMGLAFYEKALLVAVVIGWLALAYYSGGGRWPSLRALRVSAWQPLAGVAAVCLAYLAVRSQLARSPLQPDAAPDVIALVDTMVVDSFGTGLLGGPWSWASESPFDPAVANVPNAAADPQPALVLLAWLLIGGVVAFSLLRRHRAGRAWGLLAVYLAIAVGLTAAGRAYQYGPVIGQQLRYVTDTLPVAVLCLGLAFLELRGAPGSSTRRKQPMLLWQPARPLLAVTGAVLLIGAVTSTVRYAAYWHGDFPVRAYVANVRAAVGSQGQLTLADTPVPAGIMAPEFVPYNLPSRLFAPLGDAVRTPDIGNDLQTLAPDGRPVPATAEPGAVSPPGRVEGCGWLVNSDRDEVPLANKVYDYPWWVSVNYIASANGEVTVDAGSNRIRMPVERGPHAVFFRSTGTYDRLTFSDLPDEMVICVDRVVVGPIGEFTF